ncbi:hypothetical protein ACEQPO_27840 [Bacillus sp. SL00103]
MRKKSYAVRTFLRFIRENRESAKGYTAKMDEKPLKGVTGTLSYGDKLGREGAACHTRY